MNPKTTTRLSKIVIFWVLSAVGFVCVLRVAYVISHFEIPIHFSKDSFAGLASEIKPIETGLRGGSIPWRISDYSSVGFPKQEAQLIEMRRAVDFFHVKYGRLPEIPDDFLRLTTIPGIPSTNKNAFKEIANDCSILVLGEDSYILNCDGWKPWAPGEARKHAQNYDNRTEKFYTADNHVILFVPASITGTPFKPGPIGTLSHP
jgi:hypothetical protein